jgi:hypothetical protein
MRNDNTAKKQGKSKEKARKKQGKSKEKEEKRGIIIQIYAITST